MSARGGLHRGGLAHEPLRHAVAVRLHYLVSSDGASWRPADGAQIIECQIHLLCVCSDVAVVGLIVEVQTHMMQPLQDVSMADRTDEQSDEGSVDEERAHTVLDTGNLHHIEASLGGTHLYLPPQGIFVKDVQGADP